ncbi:MAG: ABC transporter permease [Bacteroidales bacterium]
MYIFNLALKRILARPGSSLLSLLLFAIGISIISLILMTDKQMRSDVEKNLAGVDLVIGAKGSPVQLILSSVLHADYPTGNINLQQAEAIASNPLVKQYIPVALGDNFRGFRIVGTTRDYADLYNAELAEGSWFKDVPEVVAGARVADLTGLQIGDEFSGVHGFQDVGHAHDGFLYKITGILKPTGTVLDNLILTPVESVWAVHNDHDHEDQFDDAHKHDDEHHLNEKEKHSHDVHSENHDHDHHENDHHYIENKELEDIRTRIEAGEDINEEEMELFLAAQQQIDAATTDNREITAMLLVYRSPAANIQLPRLVNESTNMQAASPAIELNRLLSLLDFGFDALRIIAWAIIIISGINIFMLLWNILKRGLTEIALMRVMGAGRLKVFSLLLLQGLLLATAGWVSGIILARAIWMFLPSFHFMTDLAFAPVQAREWLLLAYALLTGLLASFIPAWIAYKTDVHHTLTRPENA